MSRTLRILADQGAMTSAIIAALQAGAPVLLTFAALRDLGRELGGEEQAAAWLQQQVNTTGRPVGFNIPAPDGGSHTIFYAPDVWSQDRLAAWVGRIGETLEREFGPARVLKRERT